MHLFITELKKENDHLVVKEPRLLHQIRTVLRVQPGEELEFQTIEGQTSTRWRGRLVLMTKSHLEVEILDMESKSKPEQSISLAVALPNNSDKLAVIAQKLTEVGIDEIIFRPAQRSKLRTLEKKTLDRLEKIALEAAEQSKRWFVPNIRFVKDISQHIGRWRCVFDQGWKNLKKWSFTWGIVWPEGWFTDEERELCKRQWVETIDLWSNVLRMETAAIVGGWVLVHI